MPQFHHVIGFSDLVDLWVIKIKKPMILCARSTPRTRDAEHAARTYESFVYSIVKITNMTDTFCCCWEIYEVRKGLWAFFLIVFLGMLIGWAGKLRSRDNKAANTVQGSFSFAPTISSRCLVYPHWLSVSIIQCFTYGQRAYRYVLKSSSSLCTSLSRQSGVPGPVSWWGSSCDGGAEFWVCFRGKCDLCEQFIFCVQSVYW